MPVSLRHAEEDSRGGHISHNRRERERVPGLFGVLCRSWSISYVYFAVWSGLMSEIWGIPSTYLTLPATRNGIPAEKHGRQRRDVIDHFCTSILIDHQFTFQKFRDNAIFGTTLFSDDSFQRTHPFPLLVCSAGTISHIIIRVGEETWIFDFDD